MVRNYKRKTNRQQWEKSDMIEAVKAIVHQNMSINMAAQKFGVPKTTLARYHQKVKVSDNINVFDIKLGGRYNTIFTEEQENELKQYIKDLNYSLCEMSSLELRRIAFQYAELNNINHKFNRETGLAGYDWYMNFKRRHREKEQEHSLNELKQGPDYPITTYQINNVDKFFASLSDLYQFYEFPPNRIYNVNETCCISIPNPTSTLVSAVDKDSVNVNYVTVITCCNASGEFVPPLMIYPTDEEDPEFIKACPPGTKIVCHPSGSVQNEIFFPTWFDHFISYAKPSKTDPILLLLNGKGLHVSNLELIERAKDLSIQILSIPNKEMYRLHPLELNFMENLKKCYCREQDQWYQENKGRFITLKSVGGIFRKAYEEAASVSNAVNGFTNSGIYPLDQSVMWTQDDCEMKPAITKALKTKTDGKLTPSPSNGDFESATSSQNSGLHVRDTGNINNSSSDFGDLTFSLFSELIKSENSNESMESFEETKFPLEVIVTEEMNGIEAS